MSNMLSQPQRESSEKLLLSVFTVVLATLVIGNLASGRSGNTPLAVWGGIVDCAIAALVLYLRRKE